MSTLPESIKPEATPPFNFAAHGLIPGTRIEGSLLVDSKESVSGVVESVYPTFVLVRKLNGIRTTIHRGHIINREVMFKRIDGKREAV